MTQKQFSIDQTPFVDLPAGLVEEVINQTSEVSQDLLDMFQKTKNQRQTFRKNLEDTGLLINESSLGAVPVPTTCAADGSYAIERLLTTDLAIAAAVVVEGLAPPSEERHWELPHHRSFIAAEPHFEDTATILRAVMLGEELRLTSVAPHELLMLDCSLTLPIIYFNQAINKAPKATQLKCSGEFINNCADYLEAYLTVLLSERSDKCFVAFPKYSTRREIGSELNWAENYDDRGMLTMLLEPGELTKPRSLEHQRDSKGNISWHLDIKQLPAEVREKSTELADKVVSALGSVYVFYYKPQEWLPALRVEISKSIALNKHRMAVVVQGIKHQTATPSMLEPYPIYMADRMVKAVARAVPAFRQITTQRISEQYKGSLDEVFFAMHGYRSETGV